MMSQNLGQSSFVASLGSLGNLLELESSRRDFNNSAWLAAVALRSRAWHSNWAAKMSLTSFTMEDVTVAGVDVSCEIMEADGTPLGVVASEVDDEEDGLDKDRMDPMADVLCFWGLDGSN